MTDFRDQLPHLKAPVAEMDVTDHIPLIGAEEPLQTIADDGRAQMTDMHGFGDIRSAEIDEESLAPARFRRTEPHVLRERNATLRQRRVAQIEIDEARPCDLDLGEQRVGPEARDDLLGYRARIGLGLFRRRERAIALELREVWTIGTRDLAERLRESFRRERTADERAQLGAERGHGAKRPIFVL
jgi:hypothetical protein